MVVTNAGKLKFLRACQGIDPHPHDTWFLDLFRNDYFPVDESTLADFTVASFTGYVQVEIYEGVLGEPAIVGNVAESTFAPAPTFTCTGGAPQMVYGWYLSAEEGGEAYLAQRFDVPRLMSPGTVEQLDPFTLRLKSFT
jgi:hypothetical protein